MYASVDYPGFARLRDEYDADFAECRDELGIELRTVGSVLYVRTRIDLVKPEDAAHLADYVKRLQKFANKPIPKREVRFIMPDFSQPEDWDSRTCGDVVMWLLGGVAINPLSNQWFNQAGYAAFQTWLASGRTDMAAFIGMLSNTIPYDFYDDVNYKLYDSNSKDTSGNYTGNLVAWLDLNPANTVNGAPVWKNAAGEVVVHYDSRRKIPTFTRETNTTDLTILSLTHDGTIEPLTGTNPLTVDVGTQADTYKIGYAGVTVDNVNWVAGETVSIDAGSAGRIMVLLSATRPGYLPSSDNVVVTATLNPTGRRWVRQNPDTGLWDVDVTSSRYRLRPYEGWKLRVRQVVLRGKAQLYFNGKLMYQGAGYAEPDPDYPPGVNGNPPAPGIWVDPTQSFVYSSMSDFKAGVNEYQPPDANGYMALIYDYSKTMSQTIDGKRGVNGAPGAQQFVDIYIDNHQPMTQTDLAEATFICVNIRSL
jgi:hypothetical protein